MDDGPARPRDFSGPVFAAVVDHQDLDLGYPGDLPRQRRQGSGEAMLLIEAGNLDYQLHTKRTLRRMTRLGSSRTTFYRETAQHFHRGLNNFFWAGWDYRPRVGIGSVERRARSESNVFCHSCAS